MRECRRRRADAPTRRRHRHRQRRRAAARRLFDVRAAAHGRLRRHVDPADAARSRRLSSVQGAAAAEAWTPQPHRQSAEGDRRGPLHQLGAAKAEYDLFNGALARTSRKPAETFMTAASPGIIATTMDNEYYDSYENYVFALARELRKEYELIAVLGFLLQLDAPDFGLERARMFKDRARPNSSRDGDQRRGDQSRDGRNSRERIRLHICWGNWEGPHTHDFPLAGAAAPTLSRQGWRAQHRVRQSPTPARIRGASKEPATAGMILIPGVIDTTTNFVEHPEVVANRICEAVQPRRSQPGDRRNRLWLRHLGRDRSRVARRGLGEADGLPRGCRYRDAPALGLSRERQMTDGPSGLCARLRRH